MAVLKCLNMGLLQTVFIGKICWILILISHSETFESLIYQSIVIKNDVVLSDPMKKEHVNHSILAIQ